MSYKTLNILNYPKLKSSQLQAAKNYIFLWGQDLNNSSLGLGDDLTVDVSSPYNFYPTYNWSDIAINLYGGYALTSNGELFCWSFNDPGTSENSGFIEKSTPVQCAIGPWKSVSGRGGVLAIKTDGTLWGWSSNSTGGLGLGDTTYRSTPVQVGSASYWSKVLQGERGNALAIQSNGTLWSWGNNTAGLLGNNSTTSRSSPVQVGALSNWSYITMSLDQCFAIQSNGTLWAWGSNSYGQLGNGGFGSSGSRSPIQIGSQSNWVQVVCGYRTSRALKNDGTLWSWGQNPAGQFGNNSTVSTSTPVQVGSLSSWAILGDLCNFNGQDHCAIQSNGTLWYWGNGIITPVQVGTMSNWIKVNSGALATFAITKDNYL